MNDKVALVFPGQGSQHVGMLDTVSNMFSEVKEIYQEASDAVGYDVGKLINEGPAERLNQTEYTQVAMLVADVAYFRLFQKYSFLNPVMMAGHSLGEYAALVCAEALDFSDAVRLVAARGRIMQETVPQGKGAMAAIVGLDDETVQHICRQNTNEQEQVSPANFNSPGQVVIAGHTGAVSAALAQAEQAGAKMARVIPVSVPCHCSLLHTAAENFSNIVKTVSFKQPLYPVLSNIDAIVYNGEADIRARLARQLYMPVQWVATINVFRETGVTTVVECGPGKVLSGLIKRIDRNISLKTSIDLLNSGVEKTV